MLAQNQGSVDLFWVPTIDHPVNNILVINVQNTSSKDLKHVYQTHVKLEILLAPFLVYLSCFELMFSLVISL